MYGTAAARREVRRGAGGDTTVGIDAVAEAILLRELRALAPAAVITEEAGEVKLGRGAPALTFIIDPIDGSYNAKEGIPIFCTSVAVVRGAADGGGPTLGSVEFGYIRNLLTGEEYAASRGRGARRDGRRLRTSGNGEPELVAVEFYPDTEMSVKCMGPVLYAAKRIRSLGSIALDLCMVSCGAADAVVDVGRGGCRLLDISAGVLIVKEAGGIVTGGDLRPVDDLRVNLRNRSDIVIAGNAALHRRLASYLGGNWCAGD